MQGCDRWEVKTTGAVGELSQILTDTISKFKSGYYHHPQGDPLLSKKTKVGSYK